VKLLKVILRVSFRRSKTFHWDNSNEKQTRCGPVRSILGSVIWPEIAHPRGATPNQYVVAGRDELRFAANDQRKNRKSHLSQRKGLTNIVARILSTIPLRLD
jgi:hypothetical protein